MQVSRRLIIVGLLTRSSLLTVSSPLNVFSIKSLLQLSKDLVLKPQTIILASVKVI